MPFRNSDDIQPPSKSRLWNFNYKSLTFTLAPNGFPKLSDNQQSREQTCVVLTLWTWNVHTTSFECFGRWSWVQFGLSCMQCAVMIWSSENFDKLGLKARNKALEISKHFCKVQPPEIDSNYNDFQFHAGSATIPGTKSNLLKIRLLRALSRPSLLLQRLFQEIISLDVVHGFEAKHIGKTFWQTDRACKVTGAIDVRVANDWNKHGRKSAAWNLCVRNGTRCDKRWEKRKGQSIDRCTTFLGLVWRKNDSSACIPEKASQVSFSIAVYQFS